MGAGLSAGVDGDVGGPRFDRPIANGGYQWHYVDGVSDDGAFAVVAIALLGNPFSPAYARAAHGNPLSFCALNVAVYGRRGSVWSLTERAVGASDRTASRVAIGPSSMAWENDALVVRVDEKKAPFGGALRGTIRLRPEASGTTPIALHAAHTWWPVAPVSRIEVDLDGIRFAGHGYHDANAGDAPLETAFSHWTWSRARLRNGSAFVAYDSVGVGGVRARAFSFDRRGARTEVDGIPSHRLPRTRWGLHRSARGPRARLVRALEDTPFYARSLVRSRLFGDDVTMMHETLSCERLAARWVRFLLPFRTRRA